VSKNRSLPHFDGVMQAEAGGHRYLCGGLR